MIGHANAGNEAAERGLLERKTIIAAIEHFQTFTRISKSNSIGRSKRIRGKSSNSRAVVVNADDQRIIFTVRPKLDAPTFVGHVDTVLDGVFDQRLQNHARELCIERL